METNWRIMRAMLDCPYKAWLLSKEQETIPKQLIVFPHEKITANDKTALTAFYISQGEETKQTIDRTEVLLGKESKPITIRIKPSKRVEKLLVETKKIISNTEPPVFYKNKHCPECQFKESCYKKLKEKDCISLLGSISPKIIAKYHSKGIFSITQLSHLFRPRRRSRRKPKIAANYMWELKALAIREQKTFVMYTPELNETTNAIYIDFEGVPSESFIYLIGGLIKQEDKPDEAFYFWANSKEDEKEIFSKLFTLLNQYPLSTIYHYGSYETKTLRSVAKKYGGVLKQEFPKIEKRMINLLSYLRTYVYPPTYSNGLKELAGFLGFKWAEQKASGLQSLEWRKQWENTHEDIWKEKLLQYNQDDCKALEIVNKWFQQLAINAEQEGVQQVSEMKKESPYKFQDNPHYGEDYNFISKAAYFDYQRSKIYWRNRKAPPPAINSREHRLEKHPGKGAVAWIPKKVNEVIIATPFKKCPHCGHSKVYQLKTTMKAKRQTDIKFTSSGIKQHVTEYRSNQAKCGNPKCLKKYNNGILRMLHYGSNLFAWVINIYVNYHISHHMISKMLLEQFGIWMNPMYLVQRKYKWWRNWQPEVNYIWQIVRNSPVIHIDETNVRLSKDKGYVWVFATPHTVFYHFTLNREAEFLKEWLKDYNGVIVTDFFPGYDILSVKRQKCLVHLIRDLNDDLYKNPFDEEYKAIVISFGKLLRTIIETVDKRGLQKKFLEKHLKDTEQFYQKYLIPEHHGELAIKYTKRLKKHWDEMWMFLQYDDVPWNNNNAETAIKAFAQHRRGVNGQVSEKGLREYLEMLTVAQTCRYRNISYLDFLRRKTGIWQNISADLLPGFLPFEQAKQFIHRLGFERKIQWTNWKNEGKRPAFIPNTPNSYYKNKGWINWHDWIGFSFMSFEEARTYMRKLGLKNREEYWAWQRSGKRPKTIPASPEKEYKYTGWKDLGDWLGTGNTGQQKKKRMPYEQAKKYVQALGIKTQHEFFAWRKSGQRPETIPSDPSRVYFEFKNWGEFLGTNRIANQNRKYRSYDEAKAFLKPLNITSQKHFRELLELKIIPQDIPRNSHAYYSKQKTWVNFSDFFGR
jgi:predicted RecB family nuclease